MACCTASAPRLHQPPRAQTVQRAPLWCPRSCTRDANPNGRHSRTLPHLCQGVTRLRLAQKRSPAKRCQAPLHTQNARIPLTRSTCGHDTSPASLPRPRRGRPRPRPAPAPTPKPPADAAANPRPPRDASTRPPQATPAETVSARDPRAAAKRATGEAAEADTPHGMQTHRGPPRCAPRRRRPRPPPLRMRQPHSTPPLPPLRAPHPPYNADPPAAPRQACGKLPRVRNRHSSHARPDPASRCPRACPTGPEAHGRGHSRAHCSW